MKKIMSVFLALMMVSLLCSCAGKKQNISGENHAQIANQNSDTTVNELLSFLGDRTKNISSKYEIVSVTKINADDIIYSTDMSYDGKEYNVRFAKESDRLNADISGVYLNGKITSAVYDSANADEAPSITCEKDGEFSKAYGTWKGYYFAVSTSAIANDSMQNVTLETIRTFLG